MKKALPDMVVNNVVWGTKYVIWNGNITIECPDTGYVAVIFFSEISKNNRIEGHISKIETPDVILYEFSGLAGDVTHYYKPGSKNKRPLLDFVSLVPLRMNYPDPEMLPELASYHVWHEVNEAIVADDMPRADEVKLAIEQSQRDRISDQKQNDLEFTGTHYQIDESGMWQFLNNTSLSQFWESSLEINQESDEFKDIEEE